MSKAIEKKEPNPLMMVAESILIEERELKRIQDTIKNKRALILQGMKKNRLKSLKLDDGTVFTIKDGNRKVVIKDRAKAEAYLDEFDCWKLDSAKLLKIFGRMLKVPACFKVERGEEMLAIMSPKQQHES